MTLSRRVMIMKLIILLYIVWIPCYCTLALRHTIICWARIYDATAVVACFVAIFFIDNMSRTVTALCIGMTVAMKCNVRLMLLPPEAYPGKNLNATSHGIENVPVNCAHENASTDNVSQCSGQQSFKEQMEH